MAEGEVLITLLLALSYLSPNSCYMKEKQTSVLLKPLLYQLNTIPTFTATHARGTIQIERTVGAKTWRCENMARSEKNKKVQCGWDPGYVVRQS